MKQIKCHHFKQPMEYNNNNIFVFRKMAQGSLLGHASTLLNTLLECKGIHWFFCFVLLVFVAVLRLLSRCPKSGLLSSHAAYSSHCSDFSRCGGWARGPTGFRSCGAPAELPQGMWNLPGQGIEPVFPALAGRFLTTEPPGKSPFIVL